MWCVLSARPSGRFVHTKPVSLWQDFVFGLCGQTADQRVSLLGKGSMVKLCEVLQAGGIHSALPSRELVDFPLFFIYKSITIGQVESCNMLVSFGGISLVFR